jgi:hypothetical protein
MDNTIKNIAFTIVLNGMPFIKRQMEIIPKVFDHWFIVEGVSLPVNCTSWCSLPDKKWYNSNFCSTDGTYEFLNSINNPNITILRKNNPWNGKIEMCNAFMPQVSNSILMEFDVDEIWDETVLKDLLYNCKSKFYDFDSMKFKCNYFVGDNLKIITENSYGDYPEEWVRLWTIYEPTHFVSHEPPRIFKKENRIVEKKTTSKRGWMFDHYAYTTPEQLIFKENFYNYTNAYNQWVDMQKQTKFPCEVNHFLKWIPSGVYADKIC